MKEKFVRTFFSLSLLLTASACNTAENYSVSEDTVTASEAVTAIPLKITETETKASSQTNAVSEPPAVTEAVKDTSISEISSEYSESADDDEEIPEEIYSEEDIYIYSFECGCLSQDRKPPNEMLIIENEEQLSFAEDRYGLAVPDDLPKSDEWWYSTEAAEAFQDMKSDYPISDYSYAVCYDEVSCGGYYLHADKLIKKGDMLYFGMDDKSYTPNEYDTYPAVMGGFCHMAAVPKSLFDGTVFSNAIYPDKNELTQDIDYLFCLEWDIAGKKLFDAYGGEVYLINSQEEYEEFLKLSENVLTDNRQTKIPENVMTGSRQINIPLDFDKVSAAVCFFTTEYKYPAFHNNGVSISDGKAAFDYDIEVDPDNAEKNAQPMTCMVYAAIPKRFL